LGDEQNANVLVLVSSGPCLLERLLRKSWKGSLLMRAYCLRYDEKELGSPFLLFASYKTNAKDKNNTSQKV